MKWSNIVTVEGLDFTPRPYKVKWLVAFNQDWLIKTIESLGGEQYLEHNQIFAICFDTTPLDKLESMKDYIEVIDKYPNSSRVLDRKWYIGNFEPKEWVESVHQIIKSMCPTSCEVWDSKEKDYYEYEIVAMEGGFTK